MLYLLLVLGGVTSEQHSSWIPLRDITGSILYYLISEEPSFKN